jgi:group I intron endonuclease
MNKPFYGCIYMATNKLNNKIYIGQTRQPLPVRMQKHFDKDDGSYFHNAIQKYGKSAFRWEIIKLADNQIELSKLEQECIEKYNSMNKLIGYNLTSGGESPTMAPDVCRRASERMKGYKPSPETLEKLRIASTGRIGYWKGKKLPEHVVIGMRNKRYTPEQRERISKAKIGSIPWNKNNGGYKTVPCSDEKKARLKETTTKYWENNTKKVMCIETEKIFPSVGRAQAELGIRNIMQACVKNYAAGGYHWKYYEEAI